MIKPPVSIKAGFMFYDLAWQLALPMLSRNPRLAQGLKERLLQHHALDQSDLWIQAASVGEAYLAATILENLPPLLQTRILITTNTLQGYQILAKIRKEARPTLRVAYCPFDRPAIMQAAVNQVRPRLMILLETEIWPGLLWALKSFGTKILMINGRIRAKSLRAYRQWPGFWKFLRPDQILAISREDADRFKQLFGPGNISITPNLKFDRINITKGSHHLKKIIRDDIPFAVLGSIRQKEEEKVSMLIKGLHTKAVIGLFPRHLQRVDFWKKKLTGMKIKWILRSQLTDKSDHSIIIWDVFGELSGAYNLADTAFIGGSLAPLGGQNFLEPLICGVKPVTGPFYDNFTWVGKEIFKSGLVRKVADHNAVLNIMLTDLKHHANREEIRKQGLLYVRQRQGGTRKACQVIQQHCC